MIRPRLLSCARPVRRLLALASLLPFAGELPAAETAPAAVTVHLQGDGAGPRFEGIGVVNGGGATSVLLKDYPEPQRSQILDLVYKPKFGASVSALLVEIPGDGNSTQGSMPSHMHTREDLDYARGYTWWILREARRRNPALSLDGTAWSAPGWVGHGRFWSQDAADYYVKWLEGLRREYGLEFEALGCRNEKGYDYPFAKLLRRTLDAAGFRAVKIHAFDHFVKGKFDFVKEMLTDAELREAIGIISGHTLSTREPKRFPATPEVQAMAAQMSKPIWDTEDHVYLRGFDCALAVVQAFNDNFLSSGATRTVNWYDIAGVYPLEPFSEDPAMLLARSPWSGRYQVREALWGYAHYGQFTSVGWQYLRAGCGSLPGGGSFVSLKSPGEDYSIIIETRAAKSPQQLRIQVGSGLAAAKPLCVWRSNAREQFVRQADLQPAGGEFSLMLEPGTLYSLSTTTGQQKGSFPNLPPDRPFPFPYHEDFESYSLPREWGYLPRYTADIAGAFELTERPDKKGRCLRQVVPEPTISWAPDWQPYTILGDEGWGDYEVSADVYLSAGETAGVMGRVNHVGTGYGFMPKGYYLLLSAEGEARLVVCRGKKDKKKAVGDAEQQALIAASQDGGEGGEKELARVPLPEFQAAAWHQLKLRFEGPKITGLVDGRPVLQAVDELYRQGMAGLRASQDRRRTSRPYFDDLTITPVGAAAPPPTPALPGQLPLYRLDSSPR